MLAVELLSFLHGSHLNRHQAQGTHPFDRRIVIGAHWGAWAAAAALTKPWPETHNKLKDLWHTFQVLLGWLGCGGLWVSLSPAILIRDQQRQSLLLLCPPAIAPWVLFVVVVRGSLQPIRDVRCVRSLLDGVKRQLSDNMLSLVILFVFKWCSKALN